MSGLMRTLVSFAAGVASVGLVVGALAVAGVIDDDAPSARTAPSADAPAAGSTTTTVTADVSGLYRRVSPAVVFVQANSGRGELPFPGGGRAASGSGFVIDDDGSIVTNEHVVDKASQFRVRFGEDGKPVTAKLVGKDASTDLGVLRVDPDDVEGGLPTPLTLADQDSIHPGDPAIAIGSPFGLEGTVTTGIVSSLGRTITAPNNFPIANAIQTDAAINPGNSGGPLLNAAGQVMGITSQIRTSSSGGGNTGIGFAVPVSAIRSVVPQLRQGKEIARPYLGVATSASPNRDGAIVQRVTAGAPAADAGVRRGDRITKVGSTVVSGPDDVSAAITARKPGDTVAVTVARGGSTRTLNVKLGNRPNQQTTG
jgi:S1-C subfamily serine protease